jgi:hypothetical protein
LWRSGLFERRFGQWLEQRQARAVVVSHDGFDVNVLTAVVADLFHAKELLVVRLALRCIGDDQFGNPDDVRLSRGGLVVERESRQND